MIISPFPLDGNVPERMASGRCVGVGEKQGAYRSGCGEPDRRELPPSEAVEQAVSAASGQAAEASRNNIPTHERANVYLQQQYLPEPNGQSLCAAAEAQNYHRQSPSEAELREVVRLESERVIGNDWVVRYDNRLFQVQAQSRKYAPAQGKVAVCEWQDGTVEIEYR